MTLDSRACYAALRARDRRFDGRFFVGVSSTGIYCRPVCPARTPLAANCTFYRSPAEAEQSGYRPCLRCRPELAPGNARVDAVGNLAAQAVSRIEDGLLTELPLARLAAELGVSDRQLRRAVEQEYGVSPIAYAQTCRLLTAKRLLTDTSLPITQVAFASGFASLRRFNTLFKERYRMSPRHFRGHDRTVHNPESLSADIRYRPPFDWRAMLGFLRERTIEGCEEVGDTYYRRTVRWGNQTGWIAVTFDLRQPMVHIKLSASLAPHLIPLMAAIKRLFDLAADSSAFDHALGDSALERPGVRVPGSIDGFEIALRAVVGQQISVQAARTILGRIARSCGTALKTPWPSLIIVMPGAATLAGTSVAALRACGLTSSRARTIRALASAVAHDGLDLNKAGDPEETVDRLMKVAGVGDWTAQYIAMRALKWPDAFPAGDLGLQRALGVMTPSRARRAAESWRPWRAYMVMRLWLQLEEKQ